MVDIKPGVLDLDHLIFGMFFMQIHYMALYDLEYNHIDLFYDTFMLLFVICLSLKAPITIPGLILFTKTIPKTKMKQNELNLNSNTNDKSTRKKKNTIKLKRKTLRKRKKANQKIILLLLLKL